MTKVLVRTLLKILVTGLLLLLVVAVGTEVVALRRINSSDPAQSTPPVVVRKSVHDGTPTKTVRKLPGSL